MLVYRSSTMGASNPKKREVPKIETDRGVRGFQVSQRRKINSMLLDPPG